MFLCTYWNTKTHDLYVSVLGASNIEFLFFPACGSPQSQSLDKQVFGKRVVDFEFPQRLERILRQKSSSENVVEGGRKEMGKEKIGDCSNKFIPFSSWLWNMLVTAVLT